MENLNTPIERPAKCARGKRQLLLASKLMGEQCHGLPEGERPTWGHYLQLADSLMRIEERSKEQGASFGWR